MGLDDYKETSGVSGFKIARPEMRRTLEIIKEKKATYPSELSALSKLSESQAGRVLKTLEDDDILQYLKATMKGSDERLLMRRSEMWGRGNYGISEFNKRSWYGLNKELGFLYVIEKPDGVIEVLDVCMEIVYKAVPDNHSDESLDNDCISFEVFKKEGKGPDVEWVKTDYVFSDESVERFFTDCSLASQVAEVEQE